MNVRREIVYVSDCGRVDLEPHMAAVLDVEHWVAQQKWSVDQQEAATSVIAALDEYPEVVTAIMFKYQAAMDDAERLSHELRGSDPGLSD